MADPRPAPQSWAVWHQLPGKRPVYRGDCVGRSVRLGCWPSKIMALSHIEAAREPGRYYLQRDGAHDCELVRTVAAEGGSQ